MAANIRHTEWTARDKQYVWKLHRQGKSRRQISISVGRSPESIKKIMVVIRKDKGVLLNDWGRDLSIGDPHQYWADVMSPNKD